MKRYEFRWITVGNKSAFHLFVDGEKTMLSCDSVVSQKVVHPDGTEHSLMVMSQTKEGAVQYAWFILGVSASEVTWHDVILKPPYITDASGVGCQVGLSRYTTFWPTEKGELIES